MDDHPDKSDLSYPHRVLLVIGLTTSVIVVLLGLWYVKQVLLLAFGGILVAIFLRALTDWIRELTSLPDGLSLVLVLLFLTGASALAIWLIAPSIADQIGELGRRLPQAIKQIRDYLSQFNWIEDLLSGEAAGTGAVLQRAGTIFNMTTNLITAVVVILFVGIYGAVDPALYVRGFLRLVPPRRRPRAEEIIAEAGRTLKWWLIGRFLSMAAVGILTALGLWLLQVPLALTLGLLAAVLTFIPFLGPILSAVPAVLLALLQEPILAVYVTVLYLGIQTVESYLLTPLIQQRAVSLPPALTLTAQILLTVLAGSLGLIFATPLTALALKLTQMIYIEDVLGDKSINGKAANAS